MFTWVMLFSSVLLYYAFRHIKTTVVGQLWQNSVLIV